jgi:heptosyltransferase-2
MTGRDAVARLVLRAPNWLGDAVLAIPAMSAIRAAYAGSHLVVAAPASVAAIFREVTPVSPDAVLELPAGKPAAVAALAAGRFDACVLFPNSFRTAWQSRRAGIPGRWGFGDAARRWLLTRSVQKPRGNEKAHQSEYYRLLVRGLDIPCESGTAPALAPSGASRERADELLARHRLRPHERFVALMPGAAYGEAKQWPAARIAELAARLISHHDVRCVILGAAHDRAASRAIESWLREHARAEASRVLDLVGETSLGSLVGVLSNAELCISNDSGGMHVAAALGRPVVAIFGPTDERQTRPLGDQDVIIEPVFCRPCMLRDCPIDHRCMKRITVDRVFATASSRLSAAGVR